MVTNHRGPAQSGCAQKLWVPLIEDPDWNYFKAGKAARRSRIREAGWEHVWDLALSRHAITAAGALGTIKTCARYSITLFAIASSDDGIVRPIAFAAFRLIANSNLVAIRTGRSAGFSPLRIRPA